MPVLKGVRMARIKTRTAKDGTKRYTVEIRLKGYLPETATFARLTDARKWAASTESAILEGRHFKTRESKKHTLADAIDRYRLDILPVRFTNKEQLTRRHILDWWADNLGHHVLSDLTPALFAECRDVLIKTPSRRKPGHTLSGDTIKRYFLTINAVLKTCVVDWAWMEQSPLRDGRIELPSIPKGRIRFLDDAERNKLLEACKNADQPWLYLAVILAISTGMRQGELMNLYWKAPEKPPENTAWGVVEIHRSAIILHQTKNGERRQVPLTGHALELLKQHAKVRRLDTDLLFSGKNPSKPISFNRPWKNALKQAEINNFCWHDLRHCTASYLAMNGASLAEIAEVLGHKTLQMVKRYAHLSEAHTSKVVESMNDKIFGEI
jgi:integrase